MPHRHNVKVRFYELDPYGHLNHSAYIQLFETGRIEMLEDLGISLNELEKNNFRFVVSQIETAFLKPVEAGSFLAIGLLCSVIFWPGLLVLSGVYWYKAGRIPPVDGIENGNPFS